MFSGIVEEMGCIINLTAQSGLLSLDIASVKCMVDLSVGDSISVNGVCLTICAKKKNSFTVEAIPETLKLTNLGVLKVGEKVNLERSITASSRIGGHFVQGHVDGTTSIKRIEHEGNSLKMWFHKPSFCQECFIPKGYISIDGMSLTLVDIGIDEFSICLIPHTQKNTVVQDYQIGTRVNVEIDHITKTVVHIMNQRSSHGLH